MLTAHSEHIAEIHLDGTNFPLIFSAPCQNKQAASRVLPCVSPDFASGDSYRRIPHAILRVLTWKLLDFQNWEKHTVVSAIKKTDWQCLGKSVTFSLGT